MTELDWLTSTDPQTMLKFLRGKVSDRKLRLFAVACCRRAGYHCFEEEKGVDVAERFADGMADRTELCEIHSNLDSSGDYRWRPPHIATFPDYNLHNVTEECSASTTDVVFYENPLGERACQANCIRDMFGNPFRPISFNPTWLSGTVINIALSTYSDRAFDRLPILADALEDAGCTDADILEHCREPGEHVRGCWALDLVLCKEQAFEE